MKPWVLPFCILALASGCRAPQSTAQPTPAAQLAPPQAAPSLAGTSWLADDIGGRGVVDRLQSTLTFESETRVVGSTGCNRYFAGIQLSGTTLRVANVGSTRMACVLPAAMEQETRFLAALEAARAYRLDNNANQLWLLGENGGELARFARTGGPGAGIGTPSGPADSTSPGTLAAYFFRCTNGPSFVAIHTTGPEVVDILVFEGKRRLTRERAASGAKYSTGGVAYWNKGREATLEINGGSYSCVEERARSIREDARVRGAVFRGTGNEPAWVLEILPDRIDFKEPFADRHVIVPRPAAAIDLTAPATTFESATEAHRLQGRIEQRECLDSMSGDRFEARVELQLDGRTYRGCGYRLTGQL